jgi:hypothetical protein
MFMIPPPPDQEDYLMFERAAFERRVLEALDVFRVLRQSLPGASNGPAISDIRNETDGGDSQAGERSCAQ